MSKHKIISFIKSGTRLVGFGLLTYVYFRWRTESFQALTMFHAFLFLFLAEVLGVIEEFYEVEIPNGVAFWTPLGPASQESKKLDSEGWKNGPDGASFGVSFGPKE